MLFKSVFIEGIRAGQITLAFRRWRKPTVKAGGTLRTAAGILAIDAVEPIDRSAITAADAKRAGFDDRDRLLADIDGQRKGQLYRIAFTRTGADERMALRDRSRLTAEEIETLRARLLRFDQTANTPWAMQTLDVIARHPSVAAGDLADRLRMDKMLFKRRVRKLKDLGLTESREIGYRLAPRGKALLSALSR